MMSDLYWLTDEQMARLQPYFPKSHGRARVDDRRVLSGIIFVNRNGLRWRDAPREYGPAKTLYNRWKRWSDKGIRSEEHTSELQSLMRISYAVFCLKKKTDQLDSAYRNHRSYYRITN